MGIPGAQERWRKVRGGKYQVVGEFERRTESLSMGRRVHDSAGAYLFLVSPVGKGEWGNHRSGRLGRGVRDADGWARWLQNNLLGGRIYNLHRRRENRRAH